MSALSIPDDFEFGDAREVVLEVADLIKPPRRMLISEAAQAYLRVQAPNGNYVDWDPNLTPYLVEAMNCLNNRIYDGVVLVGPARSGKTIFLLAWLCYVLKCDPADMQIVHTSKDMAKDLSKREIDRSLANSPALKNLIAKGSNEDNIFEKTFKSGNILNLSWPTIGQLSSRTIKYIASTDYDRRAVDDVNKEGDLFGLMGKRTESFMSSGMRALETSPGFPIKDPNWKPGSEHEAPPCEGSLSYYNQGDRRRFYWPCPKCGEYFKAEWEHLHWIADEDPVKASRTAHIKCPTCSHQIKQAQRRGLNIAGKWLREGEYITPDGVIHGDGLVSNLASFWFQGPVACFQTWDSLVLEHLRGEAEYERTGLEESLKRTVTQDQGRPYLPKSREGARSYLDLMEAAEDYGYKIVPLGARFLLASVDVQKNAFDVQVEAFGLGLEHWFVDRFRIGKSERLDDDGDPMPLQPGAFKEDWELLVSKVMQRTYALADGSGREMRIRMTACDSGGEAGVTTEAYRFFRRLKRRGQSANFVLVKGAPSGPRVKKTFPDASRKDRRAALKEVPVYLLNANLGKDQVDASLSRTEPGPGCTHFPNWFDDWWYKELLAEVKLGERWEKPVKKARNESLDLAYYNRSLLVICKGEEIDWTNPPGWAKPWDSNTLVFDPNPTDDEPSPSKKKARGNEKALDMLTKLGKGLG